MDKPTPSPPISIGLNTQQHHIESAAMKGIIQRIRTTFPRCSALCLLSALFAAAPSDCLALGQPSYVEMSPRSDSFGIVRDRTAAAIYVDTNDWPGVVRVAKDLQADIQRVSGIVPTLVSRPEQAGKYVIVVGTVGRSTALNQLVREKKIDVSEITGKWEASVVQIVPRPFPGVESALVIAGSDKRGTIYGVYDLSEQIGVSPWYWWADVPPKHHDTLSAKTGRYVQGPPAIQYRGIFINDEGPSLMTWARQKYGELNHGMYTNVFELILRLKGNYLWPAMWENSFATDDPLNAKLADEYGIVISTAHHEPMMRAWKEWQKAGNGRGTWDYSKNDAKLREFWTEGLRRTKDYEKVITLGMRGDGDEPMSETQGVALLEKIVADQRKIIGEIINTNVTAVPQVWALYKEVQSYYERGMRVPDDVILLWCDDNWGDIRRLPTPEERKRTGGAGIYYHFDYVGGPRNYKWLNTVTLAKTWEQMNLARNYGADRLWIVNVGDIKPLEFPIEFFLALAWNPDRWSKDRLDEFGRLWAEREFGSKYATEIADIVAKYTKFNARRKPELIDPGTFSLENYNEADSVVAAWKAIVDQAEKISSELPAESRDAFYQLVLYPVKASAVVTELYIVVAKNRWYASHNDSRANEFAKRARELFQQDADLADYYNHTLAGGKWNHMMDQTHIGYISWQQPNRNIMPRVTEITNGTTSTSSLETLNSSSTHSLANPPPPTTWRGFVETDGYVSIEAEHFTRNTPTTNARWEILPDHGRTASALTVFPVTAPSVQPPQNSPCLEYEMWLTSTGSVQVITMLSPSLNFSPDRGVRMAVSFDNEPPEILTVVPKEYTAGDRNRDWEESVRDNVRKVKSKHTIATPGAHTFKIWMVDPAVVVQKIVIDCGGVKPSYLGPPESLRGAVAR
jgi:hypothetical protein